ncbi:MAG: AAA family ATPase [Myxococcota bacterium]
MSSENVLPAALREAFGETADPTRHVPRSRTESILDALLAWCDEDGAGTTVAALVAPPGFGKTHLLRVLESRLGATGAAGTANRDERSDARRPGPTVYLPYAAVSLPELAAWIRGLIAGSPGAVRDRDAVRPGPSERAALAEIHAIAESGAGPLLLLIDDADSMPAPTLRSLVQALPSERSPVRLVLALSDDSRAARMLAACDRLHPFEQTLREPLDERETGNYLRARLAQAGLGTERLDGLDAPTVRRIHALSGGVPRRIHRVVLALLEPDRTALARALAPHPPTADWLGQPLLDPP